MSAFVECVLSVGVCPLEVPVFVHFDEEEVVVPVAGVVAFYGSDGDDAGVACGVDVVAVGVGVVSAIGWLGEDEGPLDVAEGV